ncbi:CaiB/BaiF CoA transferase family protein [Pseudomonas sp. NPDC089743]|uniref:CaiB/BaiF CoA transferase family protein n=1 Tax=Pseudomonas sp. NPDC089743 TaxID=3364471 RepID=UPI00381C07B8
MGLLPPLDALRVLDFSTLLPGPCASLLLAEAGAKVLKIERPDGEEMRHYEPKVGADSINFALLNRGKHALAIDLKADDALARLTPLIEQADVLIEQFRPGVMQRLGLGYTTLRELNPRLIYCSISGWGQNGPKAQRAGHDLNYMAESGVLGLTGSAAGEPVLPPLLAADIAGGAYPAVINILLALLRRQSSGQGCHLDIAMAENLLPFLYWGLGNGFACGQWPGMSDATVTGGSPRYHLYRTRDGRFLAAAPLEERFWSRFCDLIELPTDLRAPGVHAARVTQAVAERIAGHDAAHWQQCFANEDVCCSIVATLHEAVNDAQLHARGVFDRQLAVADRQMPALPTPILAAFRSAPAVAGAPGLRPPERTP